MIQKQIIIITRHTRGGSWQWGKDLAARLNAKPDFKTRFTDTLIGILGSHFFVGGDLVHSAYPLSPRLSKKPLILTIHGNFKKEGLRQKFFYPKAIKAADTVTVPSEFLKNELKLSSAVVIPNAININDFEAVKLRDELPEVRILTVMQFNFYHKAKGVAEISKILNNLSRELKRRIIYSVVGDGPVKKRIENQVRNFCSEYLSINFAGRGDPKKYFFQNDIFAYCSGFDNMPIVVLEAMASGMPVVINRVGAVSEMIDNGIDGLISPYPATYFDNLRRLIDDADLRKKLGGAARKKVQDRFDWSIVLPQWISIYNELLS